MQDVHLCMYVCMYVCLHVCVIEVVLLALEIPADQQFQLTS